MDPTLLALLLVAVGGGLVLSGLGLGTWLRGGAAEQAELRHAAEARLADLRVAGLEAQLADARARLADAARLDASRVAEAEVRTRAVADGGGPRVDGVLLDLGPVDAAPARAPDAPGGDTA